MHYKNTVTATTTFNEVQDILTTDQTDVRTTSRNKKRLQFKTKQ